ncbi:MAG: DNA polymerase III subunit gamma and tau [Microbacteriaceae bacterium]
MVTALYRRYRPETFAELIGQSQVTEPLRTALRTDRVNHAYLFSGPRGCGKTTSARILARCLNCAEGPTDTPCGVCPSCRELARGGGGSLDVIEIDAASHNGVDDARELRERAIFAPARDRFKIFILDEAHMVTSAGFNALLKVVEEPPEHVKFVFATTEPEKVIGTIRSRTHHYPFRLVPPAQMLEYTQALCESEHVTVQPGVLPLVVRAGGGSVRDTLSLLDQLIAGSEGDTVGYERAVALLGYTHGALLAEVIDALGARDAAAVFAAVDRVIQTGQDPRRFVEDLLERLRDLILVAATNGRADAVLRGIPEEELQRMSRQAALLGQAELSRTADIVNAALTEMTGATSPRLHLELMMARVLVPVAGPGAGPGAGPAAGPDPTRAAIPHPAPATGSPRAGEPAEPAAPSVPGPSVAGPSVAGPIVAGPIVAGPIAAGPIAAGPIAAGPIVAGPSASGPGPAAPVTLQRLRDAWPEILEAVESADRKAWLVAYTATVRDLGEGDVLTLSFPSENDVAAFKRPDPGGQSVSEVLRTAILGLLGVRVKYIARVEAAPDVPAAPSAPGAAREAAAVSAAAVSAALAPPPAPASAAASASAAAPASAAPPATMTWSVAAIPASDPLPASDSAAPAGRPAPDEEPGWAVPMSDGPVSGGPASGGPASGGPTGEDVWAAEAPPREPIVVADIPGITRGSAVPAPARPARHPGGTETESPEDSGDGPGGPEDATPPAARPAEPAPSRYGEAVVRELLQASFIEEQKHTPRVVPRPE